MELSLVYRILCIAILYQMVLQNIAVEPLMRLVCPKQALDGKPQIAYRLENQPFVSHSVPLHEGYIDGNTADMNIEEGMHYDDLKSGGVLALIKFNRHFRQLEAMEDQ